jgi:hypothetical protein
VRYSDTEANATHRFNISISGEYEEELCELLNYKNMGNGFFSVKSYNFRIYEVTYDTADNYEFDEAYAEEDIAEVITLAIVKLATAKGGFEVIKA